MNVLEVYTSFLPRRGGVERHIYDLCKCLMETGHKSVVFAYLTPRPSPEVIDGILVHRVQIPHLFSRGFIRIIYLCLQIAYSVRRYNIDILHAHDYSPGLVSILVGVFLRKPVVVTFHLPVWSTTCSIPNYSSYSPLSLLRGIFKKCFISWVVCIICVSKYTYRETLKLGFPSFKLKVIYNWMTPLLKCKMKNLNDVRKKFDLGEKRFILSVGRLSDRHKGFSMLIGALRTLIDKGYNVDLVIVGDGPDRQMLINYSLKLGVEDRLHLLGYVRDGELACLYKGCDIFVLSSRIEGLPLTLLEAMSFGKPVVATKVGGIPEIIQDNNNGILVDPKPSALASGIEKLLWDPHLKEMFSKRSRETVQRMFSEKNCYATIDLLEMTAKRWKNG